MSPLLCPSSYILCSPCINQGDIYCSYPLWLLRMLGLESNALLHSCATFSLRSDLTILINIDTLPGTPSPAPFFLRLTSPSNMPYIFHVHSVYYPLPHYDGRYFHPLPSVLFYSSGRHIVGTPRPGVAFKWKIENVPVIHCVPCIHMCSFARMKATMWRYLYLYVCIKSTYVSFCNLAIV